MPHRGKIDLKKKVCHKHRFKHFNFHYIYVMEIEMFEPVLVAYLFLQINLPTMWHFPS